MTHSHAWALGLQQHKPTSGGLGGILYRKKIWKEDEIRAVICFLKLLYGIYTNFLSPHFEQKYTIFLIVCRADGSRWKMVWP